MSVYAFQPVSSHAALPRVRFGLSWWWMILILLLAFWLGARSLDARPIWADERRSVLESFGTFWAPGSLSEISDYVARYDPWQSPGYLFVLHEWGQAVGWEPAALRAMSLLVALIAIAFTYRLGLALFASPIVGLFATLVLASSAFYVHYSFEMRVYALMVMLSVLTFWAYVRLIQSRRAPSLGLWLTLFIGTVCLLYVHYLAAITLFGIGLYHLLFVPKNRRWWLISGVVIAGGLLFIPWVRNMLEGLELAVDKDDLHARALSIPEALWSFLYMFGNGAIALMLALIVAAFVALRGSKRLAHNTRLLLVVSVGALITLLAVNQILLIMHEGRLRYLIPLWPLFALIIGLGLVQLRRWRPLMVGVLALWVFVGLWNTVVFNFTIGLDGADFVYPVQHVARAVKPYTQPGDIVVSYTAGRISDLKDNILEFYFRPQGVDYVKAQDEKSQKDQDDLNADLLERFQQNQRVWVGYPSGETPSTLAGFQAAIATAFARCPWNTAEPYVVIELYVRQEAACPTAKAD